MKESLYIESLYSEKSSLPQLIVLAQTWKQIGSTQWSPNSIVVRKH